MKRLLLSVILATGVFAQAGTVDSKIFSFNGSKPQDDFVLNAEKTHTEYRTEVINKTCYRDEFIGYVRQCETRYETRCHIVRECQIVNGNRQCWDRQVCEQYPQTYCYDVPQYRTVAYACQETISVPYSVKDYDVQATVKVIYGALPAGLSANEGFKVELLGDQVSLTARNAKSNLLIFADVQSHENLAGTLKTMDVTYTLRFMSLADVAGPLSAEPTNFILTNNENLTWDTKALARPDLFSVHLEIKKSKTFGDKVVVDQLLPATAFDMTTLGSTTRFATTLTEAGLAASDREEGKYKVYVTLEANIDSAKLINPSNLPKELSIEGEGKFKLP